MKHFHFLTFVLLSVLALAVGCTEPETPTETKYNLSVNPRDVVLAAEGESVDVQVSTDAPSWSAKASDSWIATSVSGNTLTVTAGANSSKDSRKGTVKVMAGDISVEVSVLQSGKSDRPADDPYRRPSTASRTRRSSSRPMSARPSPRPIPRPTPSPSPPPGPAA